MYHNVDLTHDTRPTVARIDLAALRENAAVMARRAGPDVGLLVVVKADAYGHGAIECAAALSPIVWGFAVSLVEEGIELRRAGITKPIVILGSYHGRAHTQVLRHRLTPVVGDDRDIIEFANAARGLGLRAPVHLEIDTGMSRLGFRPESLPGALALLRSEPRLEVEGLCTHLCSADAAEERDAREQLTRFATCRAQVERAGFAPQLVHALNSAGTARFAMPGFALARPGIALFGYSPSPHVPIPELRPVLRLESRIVAMRSVEPGGTVSYGHYRVHGQRRIATVPIGYADGYTRRMSGRAHMLVRGKQAPLVGVVTMDMCMVDVTEIAGCEIGDEVVIIGDQGAGRLAADTLAEWAETVSWEVLATISKRVPRLYVP